MDQRGPIGITQLAQVENCAQPTMSAAVRLLAEKGWVERAADPRDARVAGGPHRGGRRRAAAWTRALRPRRRRVVRRRSAHRRGPAPGRRPHEVPGRPRGGPVSKPLCQ
ncbi:MarR family transcriptional regulator [Luedemannella flava]